MQLTLFSTDYCHLCEEAAKLIYETLDGYEYQLTIVDITESDELMERYALKIPVLREEGGQSRELDWPFTANDLSMWINQKS